MHVCAVQLNTAWEDKLTSFERARRLVLAARPPAGALVILPETFATGFSTRVAATVQGPERETDRFLQALAAETDCAVMGGAVTRNPAGVVHNESITYAPDGSLLARYAKVHPFSLGGEREVHTPGETVVTFEWAGFTIAPTVCYDLRFPELYRSAIDHGANLLVNIANWPVKRDRHWLTLLQARAIENLAYVVGVNRAGTDPQFTYSGRSVVVDPHGVIIADAGGEERVLSATLELELVHAWRREFPALRDRHWQSPGHDAARA